MWLERFRGVKQGYPPKEMFSVEEWNALIALRQRSFANRECVEFCLDVRRLNFARWLVQHGRLSEQTEDTSGSPVGVHRLWSLKYKGCAE